MRARSRHRSLWLLASLTVAGVVACERVTPSSPVPHAEFIIAAADSVFWVRSDDDGIRVRGAPLSLALVGGRFVELFLSDVDQSFYDAVYVGQRLTKRDLVTGDSLVIFSDTLIPVLARAYAAANPDERPLGDDEEGSENPRTIASAEIAVLDVLGPWLSYEYRTDVDVIGGQSAHGSRRGVIDLRTGSATSLEALLGPRERARVIAEGREQWRVALDSLRLLMADRSEYESSEVDRLSVDPRSFTLSVVERQLHIRFAIAQSAARDLSGSYELEGIKVAPPEWWSAVRAQLPVESNSGERHWRREGFTLVARDVTERAARVSFALRDEAGTEWRLGSVPSPVFRVMWIDDSLAPGSRAALVRAFNESALVSEDVRIALAVIAPDRQMKPALEEHR